jgi:acetoin utilization protein AcuC
MAKRSAFIYTSQFEKYHYPDENPFKTERAGKTRSILESMNLLSGPHREEIAPNFAPRNILEKFHTPRYLDALDAVSRGELDIEAFAMGIGSEDCPVFKNLYEYTTLTCGATVEGAKLIANGSAEIAFNPSGGYHHAFPEKAAGFCYLNDIVLGCMLLAEQGKKVLFLDLDIHHCDGVQDAFYDNPDVMTLSLHESGKTQFPGTGFEDEIGVGNGLGYCVNVPMPVGTYDGIFLKAFHKIVLPMIEAFGPDVIVLELGMDGLGGDPLGHWNLTNNVFADAINMVLKFNKPILATGGGGYNIENTARGWALAWSVLTGQDMSEEMGLGMGGVMLESAEWQGGLRDRIQIPDAAIKSQVDPQVEAVIEKLKATLFPLHNL